MSRPSLINDSFEATPLAPSRLSVSLLAEAGALLLPRPEYLLSDCVFDQPPIDSSPVFSPPLLLQEENVAISPRAKQRQQLLGLCWRWRPVKIP